MSQLLNPNTLLPMSLEVDRINQIQKQQPVNQQLLTSNQVNIKNNKKQKQINEKSKAEQGHIKNDNHSENRQYARDDKQQNDKKDKKRYSVDRGNYIDVNI